MEDCFFGGAEGGRRGRRRHLGREWRRPRRESAAAAQNGRCSAGAVGRAAAPGHECGGGAGWGPDRLGASTELPARPGRRSGPGRKARCCGSPGGASAGLACGHSDFGQSRCGSAGVKVSVCLECRSDSVFYVAPNPHGRGGFNAGGAGAARLLMSRHRSRRAMSGRAGNGADSEVRSSCPSRWRVPAKPPRGGSIRRLLCDNGT